MSAVTMTAMEAGTGLRERKKERTHEAIREAASELFHVKGFDGTTVDDIAAAADVSPRTFFRYYANKEEVLFSRFDETLELLRHFLAARPDTESVGDALRAASSEFASLGQSVSRDRATFAMFTANEALHARYLQSFFHLEEMTAEWIAERTGRPAGDSLARTLGAVLASGARIALDVWVAEPGRDLQELLDLPLAMIESALAR